MRHPASNILYQAAPHSISSNSYISAYLLLFWLGMKTQMTTKLLQHLSRSITNGNPIWGILHANEYLEQNAPLRLALVKRARSRLETMSVCERAAFERAASGARLAELPIEHQESARLNHSSHQRRREFVFTPRAQRSIPTANTRVGLKRSL